MLKIGMIVGTPTSSDGATATARTRRSTEASSHIECADGETPRPPSPQLSESPARILRAFLFSIVVWDNHDDLRGVTMTQREAR